MKVNIQTKFLLPLFAVTLISACSGDDKIIEVEVPVEVPAPQPVPVDYIYEVSVTNLTAAQPLSPVALVAHADGKLWMVGEAASVALEQLAEGGDNAAMLASPGTLSTSSGAGVILPGDSETIAITVSDNADALLSFSTMLVNTNDAFAGLNAYELSQLDEVGASWGSVLPVLDAGTELNSEAAGTIPGPADGGEGYNPMRVGRGIVTFHPGAVTSSDGLDSSVLTVEHKFDNPAVRFTVTRVQ